MTILNRLRSMPLFVLLYASVVASCQSAATQPEARESAAVPPPVSSGKWSEAERRGRAKYAFHCTDQSPRPNLDRRGPTGGGPKGPVRAKVTPQSECNYYRFLCEALGQGASGTTEETRLCRDRNWR